jgi:hypothetical protein
MYYRVPGFLAVVYGSFPLPSPPPPPTLPSLSSTVETQEDWERETTYWQKGGGWKEAKSYEEKKVWYSIKHYILSGSTYSYFYYCLNTIACFYWLQNILYRAFRTVSSIANLQLILVYIQSNVQLMFTKKDMKNWSTILKGVYQKICLDVWSLIKFNLTSPRKYTCPYYWTVPSYVLTLAPYP